MWWLFILVGVNVAREEVIMYIKCCDMGEYD